MSKPIGFNVFSFSIKSSISVDERPQGTIHPTAGANAGSMLSISNEMYTVLPFVIFFIFLKMASIELSLMSSGVKYFIFFSLTIS